MEILMKKLKTEVLFSFYTWSKYKETRVYLWWIHVDVW